MVNDALLEFSQEFGIPVDFDEIIFRLIEEITKLREEKLNENESKKR